VQGDLRLSLTFTYHGCPRVSLCLPLGHVNVIGIDKDIPEEANSPPSVSPDSIPARTFGLSAPGPIQNDKLRPVPTVDCISCERMGSVEERHEKTQLLGINYDHVCRFFCTRTAIGEHRAACNGI
jgi:hypothetical protein